MARNGLDPARGGVERERCASGERSCSGSSRSVAVGADTAPPSDAASVLDAMTDAATRDYDPLLDRLDALRDGEGRIPWLAARRLVARAGRGVVLDLATLALLRRAAARRRDRTLVVEKAAQAPAARRTAAYLRRLPVDQLDDSERQYLAGLDAISEKHAARLLERLGKTLTDYAAGLRIEWTAQLLASPFALPDGTQVTWGAATIDQHRLRVAMFSATALASLEGAGRHERAVCELQAAGVGTLAELVAVQSREASS